MFFLIDHSLLFCIDSYAILYSYFVNYLGHLFHIVDFTARFDSLGQPFVRFLLHVLQCACGSAAQLDSALPGHR